MEGSAVASWGAPGIYNVHSNRSKTQKCKVFPFLIRDLGVGIALTFQKSLWYIVTSINNGCFSAYDNSDLICSQVPDYVIVKINPWRPKCVIAITLLSIDQEMKCVSFGHQGEAERFNNPVSVYLSTFSSVRRQRWPIAIRNIVYLFYTQLLC